MGLIALCVSNTRQVDINVHQHCKLSAYSGVYSRTLTCVSAGFMIELD